jgi:hypothetical protein
MNTTKPEPSWLDADEWQGDNGLLGNRRGLEILRDAIDQVLVKPEEVVVIPIDDGSIRVLKLCDPPPPPAPTRFRDKLILAIIIAILIGIPLLALFGLHQLIKLLSS